MRSGKIIMLEADGSLRINRVRTLSREGYNVTGVACIEEAIEATRQQPYDLLIVGAGEPEQLDSLLTPLPPEISVLVLAAFNTIGKVVEHAGTGIHTFLLEPVSLSKLRSTVARIITSTRLVKGGIRSEILTSLARTNWSLASESETEQFFKRVVEISAADTEADNVVLLVKDEATDTLVTRAHAGKHPPDMQAICNRVTDTGEPVLIDEKTRDPELHRLMTDAGAAAIMCVPLLIKGNVVGAIGHTKVTKGAKFSANDLSFASLIAWWCSMALENARLFSRIQRQYLHMERLLEEIRVAQENERRRVAVEIHDGVAQWMVGASYGIKAIGNLISEQRLAELELELTKISDTVQTSIRELRRAISNLRPLPLEELGLTQALQQAVESLKEDGIKCNVEIDGDLPQLTPAEESTTYWIVQEILSNIRKHAGASEVTARIRCHDNMFSVEVSDNGQGFSPERVINSESRLVHLGLLGMKERAELIGGNLNIKSKQGKGTTVSFAFPVSSLETVEAATSG
ncbi:MAG TPA: GAF domain-containing protein [Dehalococcoidia bacterium]|nr:GAF domain-containing protein [Dehalococcoidia bacterium]